MLTFSTAYCAAWYRLGNPGPPKTSPARTAGLSLSTVERRVKCPASLWSQSKRDGAPEGGDLEVHLATTSL